MKHSDIYVYFSLRPYTTTIIPALLPASCIYTNTTSIRLKPSKTHFSSESIAASRNNSVLFATGIGRLITGSLVTNSSLIFNRQLEIKKKETEKEKQAPPADCLHMMP